jgi:heat shock protein HtpX
VLGHEISHVNNGDMVTLTLIQGVLNTFVIFLARIVGNLIDRSVFRSESGRGPGYFVTVIVAEIVFGLLASVIVAWFSRQREFRADRGGAQLAGRQSMISALERLKGAQEPLPQQFAAFGITEGAVAGGLRRLFMSHRAIRRSMSASRRSARGSSAKLQGGRVFSQFQQTSKFGGCWPRRQPENPRESSQTR